MHDTSIKPVFKEKLNYIFTLWFHIIEKDHRASVSEILLASKRLVEEYSSEDVKRSVREYEKLKISISTQQAIEKLNTLTLCEKYKILIDLFMMVTLSSVNNQNVQMLYKTHQFDMNDITMLGLNNASMTFLKDIYMQCNALFLYDALFNILDHNCSDVHSILKRKHDIIEFIYLDNQRIADSYVSTDTFDVKFSILKIDQSFILINTHSSALSLYEFNIPSPEKKVDNDMETLVHTFNEQRELFEAKVIGDHAAYSLNKNMLLHIKNSDKAFFMDYPLLVDLFKHRNELHIESYFYEDHTYEKEIQTFTNLTEVECDDVGIIQKLVAKELSCGYTPTHAINKHINFEISKGELVAIMGPSGVGKSTLMKTMIGKACIVSGELSVNCGYELSKKYYANIGYVPQDDVLIKELTVYDNMYYYYRLHFGSKESDAVIEKIIDEQLRNLGIFEIKNSPVYEKGEYQISGGQCKRLNIAMELIKDVDLLLIDEPTSGLSSIDSEKIIQLLKKITDSGKIVITIIHQPSSSMYQKFDQVILFNEDGYNIYTDKAMEVLRIFKLIKEEEIYLFDDKDDYEDVKCPACHKTDPEILLEVHGYEKSKFWNLFAYLKFFVDKKDTYE